jgi:hypothetical protein
MEKQLTLAQQKELVSLARTLVNGIEEFKMIGNTSPDYKKLKAFLDEIDPPETPPSRDSFTSYLYRRDLR